MLQLPTWARITLSMLPYPRQRSATRQRPFLRPTIVTQNNVMGMVQQGTQVPVQTTINNTISVQYVDATLQLQVTPQVTDDSNIFLVIKVQNNTVGAAIASVGPEISTQQATTSGVGSRRQTSSTGCGNGNQRNSRRIRWRNRDHLYVPIHAARYESLSNRPLAVGGSCVDRGRGWRGVCRARIWIVPCSHAGSCQPCQKSPSTNTATFSFRKTMSGLPGTL